MKILCCEWASGGGAWWDDLEFDPTNTFVDQGHRMIVAVGSDFLNNGFEVEVFRDSRFESEMFLSAFDPGITQSTTGLSIVPVDDSVSFDLRLVRAASTADLLMVVAPETGGRLLACSHWLKLFRSKCVFPTGEFLVVASSKTATAQRLSKRFPKNRYYDGLLFDANSSDTTWPPEFPTPAVLKLDDGAGSEGMVVVDDWRDVTRPSQGLWRIESRVPGVSVSFAAIANGIGFQLLEPLYQVLASDPPYHYLASRYPVTDDHYRRARTLAAAALESLGNTQGYVGLDMILHESDETFDTIVDVNPRLTTSYLTQRKLAPIGSMLTSMLTP